MRTMNLIVAAALLIPSAMVAQDRTKEDMRTMTEQKEKAYDPQVAAAERAKQYQEALGLTEEQTQSIAGIFSEAEQESMPIRKQCDALQQRMQLSMDQSNAKAERILDEKQQQKLAELRKSGEFTADAVSCGLNATAAKGGACCASKAQADKAAKAEKEQKIERTQEPQAPAKNPARR